MAGLVELQELVAKGLPSALRARAPIGTPMTDSQYYLKSRMATHRLGRRASRDVAAGKLKPLREEPDNREYRTLRAARAQSREQLRWARDPWARYSSQRRG